VVMGEKALPANPVSVRGGSIEISEKEYPRTSLGSGVGVGVGARRPRTHATPPERQSRAVSFADSAHPRPSLQGSRYSRGSRAFHTASTYDDFAGEEAPPVPALPSPARAGAFGAISAIGSGSPTSGAFFLSSLPPSFLFSCSTLTTPFYFRTTNRIRQHRHLVLWRTRAGRRRRVRHRAGVGLADWTRPLG
jgi:hypothetical protein